MSVLTEKQRQFALRAAKVWQNYFELHNVVLPGITLSTEQMAVIQQDEDHLLIQGPAGSGKSITLLYKLFKVMEQEEQQRRILYCSFNKTLIDHARKLYKQSHSYPELKAKHEVRFYTFHYMAAQLLRQLGIPNLPPVGQTTQNALRDHEGTVFRRVSAILDRYRESDAYRRLPAVQQLYQTHTGSFLAEEILWMKANGFVTEEAYLNCDRIGRGHNPRLTKEQRKTIYTIYEMYQHDLKERFRDDKDLEDYALLLLKHMDEIPDSLKYDYIFVDEVQDLQPMQLKALVLLTKHAIVLAGDSKQRIYKRTPFSYRELGLRIEGRKTRTLHTNFRSTQQIMRLAESLQFLDVEGEREPLRNYVRQGPKPQIHYFADRVKQNRYITKTIKQKLATSPGASVAIIHRFDGDRNLEYNSGIYYALSREFDLITTEQYGRRFHLEQQRKPVFFTDAFSVKGLEFDLVFILHFDRYHYPSERRIRELDQRASGDKLYKFSDSYLQDEEQIHNDEKKILYVAMTRAREALYLLYHAESPLRISSFVRDFPCEYFEAYGFDKKPFCKK